MPTERDAPRCETCGKPEFAVCMKRHDPPIFLHNGGACSDHHEFVAARPPVEGLREAARTWFMNDRYETAVVQMSHADKTYWWVLCPAASTLVLDVPVTVEDEANCSTVCEWVEEHAWADSVIQREVARAARSGGEGAQE